MYIFGRLFLPVNMINNAVVLCTFLFDVLLILYIYIIAQFFMIRRDVLFRY